MLVYSSQGSFILRVSGIILCGGQGRRMQGRDKGWIDVSGRPMIERVVDRFKPQVSELLINANRNIDQYRRFNLPILTDTITGYQGPLAGILSGLNVCENDYLACVPCDCPFFPLDLVARMVSLQAEADAEIVSVSDGDRTHPVFALIHTKLKNSLEEYLNSGQRKIDRWYAQHCYQVLEYKHSAHCFANINTPEQLEKTNERIRGYDS